MSNGKDEGLLSEPAYYKTRSTRAERRRCLEGLPKADCEFFHGCMTEGRK